MNDQYLWLTAFLADPKQRTGLTIGGIVPDNFQRYFIIEWNYGIINDFPFDEYPPDSLNIEDLNRQHAIKKKFGLFLDNNTEHLFQPITIKELAERYAIPYNANTIHEIPYTPGISTLLSKTTENLNALVCSMAGEELLNLYIDDLYRFPASVYKDNKNQIPAGEYTSFIRHDVGSDSCSYLFPHGHEWCFITAEDFPCLILATNSDSAKLTSIDSLEYFEVDSSYPLFK